MSAFQEETSKLRGVLDATATLPRMDDFRELVEKSLDGLLVHREGAIVYTNPSFCRMLGFSSSSELIGRSLTELLSPEEPNRAVFLHVGDKDSPPLRVRLLNSAGKPVIAEVAPPQQVHFAASPALLVIARDISERQKLEKDVLDVSSRERQRLAHDLHDGLGQELGGIAFKARALQDALEEKLPDEAPAAAEIVKLIGEALTHARGLAHGLDPAVERQSFPALLGKLVTNTQRLFRVSCQLTADPSVHIESATVAQNLYRMAQEAIHNAIRHGRARRIEVNLSTSDGFLVLTISDDGAGFTMERSTSGMGLRVMQHRNHTMGGSLQIVPRPGGGTEVCCRVPLPV